MPTECPLFGLRTRARRPCMVSSEGLCCLLPRGGRRTTSTCSWATAAAGPLPATGPRHLLRYLTTPSCPGWGLAVLPAGVLCGADESLAFPPTLTSCRRSSSSEVISGWLCVARSTTWRQQGPSRFGSRPRILGAHGHLGAAGGLNGRGSERGRGQGGDGRHQAVPRGLRRPTSTRPASGGCRPTGDWGGTEYGPATSCW